MQHILPVFPCILLIGMPDCMRRITLTQNHTLPARIQNILIKGTFDKTTKTETVLSHGFKIYQIINALEQANIQTEITIAFSSNKYSMYDERDYYFYETYIKVKESTEIQTVNDMIKQQYEKAR